MRALHGLSLVLAVLAIAGTAFGLNYLYFTGQERTVFNDRIKFQHGDTLDGPVRSNDTIAIMGDPRFYDLVITTASDFWRGSGYNPQLDWPFITGAPQLPVPQRADRIRQQALDQGFFFDPGQRMKARIHLVDHGLRIWWAQEGQPFDSTIYDDRPLPDSAVVFFDCPLSIWGTVSSTLILGAGGTVGLEDNILYASSEERVGRLAPGHPEKFALVSEADIKILNTVANGRENSSGEGFSNPELEHSSIALNGFYFTLNESFTFAEQNDADSGYVCTCSPDDRGQIWLWGGLAQARRGYVHRANRGSTGYLRQYRYDSALQFWNIGVFDGRENVVEPERLDFGAVAVGDTASDTVHVFNDFVPIRFDSLRYRRDVWRISLSDSLLWDQQIIVTYTPSWPGVFLDTLWLKNEYYNTWLAIPLRAAPVGLSQGIERSATPTPTTFGLSAFPNPFNPVARIDFNVTRAGETRLEVFDILGQKVATLQDGYVNAGKHSVIFDGASQPAGIYLARLTTPYGQVTSKLMLLK